VHRQPPGAGELDLDATRHNRSSPVKQTGIQESTMSERTFWESVKVEGGQVLDKLKQVVREGNVRRIVVKQGDRTVAEFPLTVGVVGAVFSPVLAAVGAIVALSQDCSIEIERAAPASGEPPSPTADAPATEEPVEAAAPPPSSWPPPPADGPSSSV
jgi:hypothetical protein